MCEGSDLQSNRKCHPDGTFFGDGDVVTKSQNVYTCRRFYSTGIQLLLQPRANDGPLPLHEPTRKRRVHELGVVANEIITPRLSGVGAMERKRLKGY